jgi:hypothetical protein
MKKLLIYVVPFALVAAHIETDRGLIERSNDVPGP